MKSIDSAAARQGEKPYPLAQFPFEGTPVDVLIRICLSAKKDGNIAARAFLVHKSSSYPLVIGKKSAHTVLGGIDAADGNRLP